MDGVLVVDKQEGPTSHDVVARVRRALAERRVGHMGTLDPFATGVLALCLGKATRLARFMAGGEKVYRAAVRLGFATATDDLTGEPLGAPRPCLVSRDVLVDALARLVGSYDQVPPAFSARHVAGRRFYELARRGEATPRVGTPVTVYAIELLSFSGERLEIEVRCSPGTYVRALARDLGDALGVGGHLTALRRTRSGGFDLAGAVPSDRLDDARQRVIPLRSLLGELPAIVVGDAWRRMVKDGRDLGSQAVSGFPGASVERVRLVDERGDLLAIAVPRGFDAAASGLPELQALHPEVVLID